MKSTNPHTLLVNEILNLYENSSEIYVWKNNSGSVRVGKRFISFGKVGSPDLIGVTKQGKFIGIECKTGKAVLTNEQKVFRLKINQFGGVYLIARSVNCVIECVHKLSF